MGPLSKFRHGSVTYPLEDATDNSLLEDADPALFYALDFFSSMLDTYVGPRLLAQAALESLRFPSAVEKTIHFEPTPFLLSDQLIFPLFCLYRVEGEWTLTNKSKAKSTSTWEWAYVLPPLGPREIEQLHPILRSVEVTIATAAIQTFDPGYEDGATLRDLSGIQKILPGRVRYGGFEPVDGEASKWWRAVSGQLIVEERDDFVIEETEAFDGANITLDLAKKHEQTVEEFVEINTLSAPVIETIAPDAGTKAGGAVFNLVGRNFVPGSVTKVLIGGAYATNVVVTHPTTLVGLTPAHDAAPTFAADVQIINPDGQVSNLLEAAYTFTTP